MVFGLSYGETALIMITAIAAFGPKDIPVVARAVGRLTGRSVAYLLKTKETFSKISEKSQIKEMHKELHETMAQVQAIRYELSKGMNPLTFSERFIHHTSKSIQRETEINSSPSSSSSHPSLPSPSPSPSPSICIENEGLHSGKEKEMADILLHSENFNNRISKLILNSYPLTSNDDNDNNNDNNDNNNDNGDGNDDVFIDKEMLRNGQFSHTLFLPVSAVRAGLIPQRKGCETGGDIISDALIEREVGIRAMEALKSL